MLNDRFKRQCNEIFKDRVLRHEANKRESSNQPAYTKQKSIQNQPKPSSTVITRLAAGEGYLEPIPAAKPSASSVPSTTSSGYVEAMKQNVSVAKPSTIPIKFSGSGGYLMPSTNKSKMDDTYGGMPGTYRPLEKDTYSNDLLSRVKQPVTAATTTTRDNRYMNEDVVNELESARFSNLRNKIEYIDSELSSQDGYMMPRHASTMSAGSTASSTAPLLGKFNKSEKPNIVPQRYKPNNRDNNIGYIPPPVSPFSSSQLTAAKPSNETEV